MAFIRKQSVQDLTACTEKDGNAAWQYVLSRPAWHALCAVLGGALLERLLCTHTILCPHKAALLQVAGCPVSIVAQQRKQV